MAKNSGRPLYTPRFGSQVSLKKRAGGGKSQAAPDVRRRPVDLEQTGQKLKAMKPAKLKLLSLNEGPAAIKSTSQQSPNMCPKTAREGTETEHRAESGPSHQARSVKTADAFSFSFQECGTPSKQNAVKQAVLRTVSKMLEENRVIRRRLTACKQDRERGTDRTDREDQLAVTWLSLMEMEAVEKN